MFPNQIDGADVLSYTDYGDYGCVLYTTGEIADNIHYYCIAQYKGEESYYLFGCDSGYEVVCDSLWGSIEMCRHIVKQNGYHPIWHAVHQ